MRPVIEKQKFGIRHMVYIIIIIICIIAVGIAVYKQFFEDEKLGLIFGITNEEDDEEYNNLKENFLNIFDNRLNIIEEYTNSLSKIKEEEDIILLAYNTQEQTENYTLDLKIPYFNINSEICKKFNQEIKSTFKDKSESVISSKNNEGNNILYNVKYKAYIKNNILSLVILSELKEGNSNERIIIQTYNYNLIENREVTIDEILKEKNINENYANNKIKEEVNSSQKQNIKLAELGYNTNVRDVETDMYKVENVEEFFIGEKGYLYIIYPYGNNEFTSEMDVIIFR